MNIRDMTDAEVYELGLQILLDKLGTTGRLRFLEQCKPCTGDYTAERHESLDNTSDIKTIINRIQERRDRKQAVPESEPSNNISEMSDIEVYELGLKAISGKLGPLGIVRFVHLFDTDKNADAVKQHASLGGAEQGIQTSIKDTQVERKRSENKTG